MNAIKRWVANLSKRRAQIDPLLYELMAGAPTYAGPRVDEESAMRSAAVFGCIRIISESVASLPLIVYRQNGRAKSRATDHPLYRVLHNLANPEMTSFEWRENAFAHVCAWGNHWSEKQYDSSGRVVALWPLRPDRMEGWERRADGIWWAYRLPDNSGRMIPAHRLHHIKALGDGVMGHSPIRWAAKQSIGLALATEEFGARFFSNGARPGALLKHPGRLSDKAYERLKAQYADAHQGLSNAHRMKILEEGMDIATIGTPPNEAQFLETRKFQVTEIARIFRVPPHMLADLDRATFSNIEHMSLNFVMYTLMPWLSRHEQAMYRDLFTAAERDSVAAKYKVDGLLRGDTATRHQAYNMGILTGYYTRNEVRELEDLNPLDGLDEPLIPLNMMEVGAEPPAPAQPQAQRNGKSPGADMEQRANRAESDRRRLMNRHVRLFEDALGRVVKREIADIRKAANSRLGKRDVESFRGWLEGFYRDLRGWMPDYLSALMLTYAESMFASVEDELGDGATPDGDELRDWIAGYLQNFVEVYAVGGEKQLRSLLEEAEDDEDATAKIHERLDGWEENRAQKTAFDQAFEAGNALAVLGYVTAGAATLVWRARGESCPLCRKLNGTKIRIGGAFADEGDTVTADGVDPLPIVRKIRHGPLHGGCDCVVTAG